MDKIQAYTRLQSRLSDDQNELLDIVFRGHGFKPGDYVRSTRGVGVVKSIDLVGSNVCVQHQDGDEDNPDNEEESIEGEYLISIDKKEYDKENKYKT